MSESGPGRRGSKEQDHNKPTFLEQYEGRRPLHMFRRNRGKNYGFDSEEQYRFAKRVSWALAYKKIFDQIEVARSRSDVSQENAEQISAMRKNLKQVFDELEATTRELTSGMSVEAKDTAILNKVPAIDEQLAQIEEDFPDLVRQAKKSGMYTIKANGKLHATPKDKKALRELVHTIEKSETFPQITALNRAKGSLTEPGQGLRATTQQSGAQASPTQQMGKLLDHQIQILREDPGSPSSSQATNEEDVERIPVAPFSEVLPPEELEKMRTLFQASSANEQARTAASGGTDTPDRVDIPEEAMIAVIPDRSAELVAVTAPLAFREIMRTQVEIDDLVEADLRELTRSAYQVVEDFEKKGEQNQAYQTTLKALYTTIKESAESDQFAQNPHGTVDKIDEWAQEHLNRKLTFPEKRLFEGTVKAAADQYRKALDTQHPAERIGMAVAAFIGHVVYTVSIVGPIVQNSRGKKAAEILVPENLMQCYDPLTKSRKSLQAIPSLGTWQKDVEGIPVAQLSTILPEEATNGLIVAIAPPAFRKIMLTQVEIDDLVEADLRELTSSGFQVEEDFEKKKEQNQAYQTTLKALYTRIKEYAESDEFTKKPNGVVDKIDEWAQEYLNRKLARSERDTFQCAVGSAAQEYHKALDTHPAARIGMAVAAFIGHVVYAVSIVGPIVQALRGKKAAEILVPETLMQCYDPSTKSKKSLFSELDKAAIDAIKLRHIKTLHSYKGKMKHEVSIKAQKKEDAPKRL